MPAKAGIQNRPIGRYFFQTLDSGFRRNDDVVSGFLLKEALIKSVILMPANAGIHECLFKPLDSGFRRNDEKERVYLFRGSLR